MRQTLAFALSSFGLCLAFSSPSHAWGRHDLITKLTVDSPELATLRTLRVTPEPIEKAAPDLLARVIPDLEHWCERYHHEHDTRYAWTSPLEEARSHVIRGNGRTLNDREALLWALEDNIDTPLVAGHETSAAEVLVQYADEPDKAMDDGLNKPPYIDRMRASMSLFYEENNPHTHTYRHLYVPTSLIPPILTPKGIAPYRADLYAHLAEGAFETGHVYWGFRFLAWSLHYVQDVTQPWHTVFVPTFSLLSFSREKMRHDIAALHYLTEAFSDTWLSQAVNEQQGSTMLAGTREREPAAMSVLIASAHADEPKTTDSDDPWFVSREAEGLASAAHDRASEVAGIAQTLFAPIVAKLKGPDLKPDVRQIPFGGMSFPAEMLDFSGNGAGATEFLSPIWSTQFTLTSERDALLKVMVTQLQAAINGSRLIIAYTLNTMHLLNPVPTRHAQPM